MSDSYISSEQAQKIAATVAHTQAGVTVTVDVIERLDGGDPYYLVIFGDAGSSGAIVTIDMLRGHISSSAKLQRVERPWVLDKEKAVEIAGCKQALAAKLVWKASRATLSPFYPLWEITCEAGVVYIDRSGKLWRQLLPAGPG